MLEVGCGNSIWLPYLGSALRCTISGVDFSEEGCRLAELNLAAMGVPGNIICADFFNYASQESRCFDAVISFGFVEHFSDPANVLRAMSRLVRKGGMVMATIPNLTGIYGQLQQIIDKKVLDAHVVMQPEQLIESARDAGLVRIEAGYLGGAIGLRLLNLTHIKFLPKFISHYIGHGLAQIDWALIDCLRLINLNNNQKITSPMIYVFGFQEQ